MNNETILKKKLSERIRKNTSEGMRIIRKAFHKEKNLCTCSICEMEADEERLFPNAVMVIGSIFLAAILLIGSCHPSTAHADSIPADKAIKALIGEGENQGVDGMNALAHTLRNRGTLKGVYGINSPRVNNHLYSAKTYQLAKRSWEESAYSFDITKGATGWGNASDIKIFEATRWFGRCQITVHIKDHWFYKCDVK